MNAHPSPSIISIFSQAVYDHSLLFLSQ
jgi:hypothetical protein